MRVVFMGTPPAAVPVLEALAGSHQVPAVYTQSPKPAGRGLVPRPPALRAAAERLGLQIREPGTLQDESEALAVHRPDVLVVVAYGKILPPQVLSVPKLGCVNVHFSLLPRWRGAAPVERAIEAGDDRTGVTTMLMDEGLDTGAILRSWSTSIGPDETAGELTARLANAGATLLLETLEGLARGSLRPAAQPSTGVTYAAKVTVEQARLDPARPSAELHRMVRAFNPSPGAWILFRGKRLKVWRSSLQGGGASLGGLGLVEVQPEGKRRMTGDEFARGYRPIPADFGL